MTRPGQVRLIGPLDLLRRTAFVLRRLPSLVHGLYLATRNYQEQRL